MKNYDHTKTPSSARATGGQGKKIKEYNHLKIESKWQKEWEKKKIYEVKDSVKGKENFYTLVEFTYPSGNLHVGHWYAFAVPDILVRYKRMRGFNVLYPMGFDAFGLPAENAAIKLGANPKKWTYTQMDIMRTQLKSMGAVFDWDREIISCDPEYYRWTQWMFNQFLKKDLVYRDITQVNWCPKDQTILANEQVVDGCCQRCGTEVEQRNQEQWMLRITKYADRLIDDLDNLDWPEEIKTAQRNWIGRSEGSEIFFELNFKSHPDLNKNRDKGGNPARLPVFTTRADTLFGATYLVLAPEHVWVTMALDENHTGVIDNADEVREYVHSSKKKSELERKQSKEKTGVEVKGVKAINPINGEEIPLWIADYVLAGYGTGAIMAVPAHDERDFEFAKTYNLPIKRVVEEKFSSKDSPIRPELPLIPRNAICAIIRNPKDGKYLCSVWRDIHMHGLITGGVEEQEDIEVAAIREIYEETGYKNVKLVHNPDIAIHSFFYHRMKEQNRWARFQYLFFDLINEEQDEIAENEKAVHEIVWKSKDELKNFFSVIEGEFVLNILDNKPYLFTGEGILGNSGEFNDMSSLEARKKITEAVGGKIVKTYRLRDWGISRQRYWGTPIPIVYDPKGHAHPVPDKHLPWLLPTDVDHTPDGTSPLARSKEMQKRTEKIFGKGWKPEVETMDTFVDSSWYFYRYLDPKSKKTFASEKHRNAWMPINLYMGGAEHTTMHLLYSRFWVKALHDLGLVKEDEAYTIRRNRGLILGPDGNKMSKSKGNVINPDEIVKRLGADTVRMYLAFMGPYGVTVNYPWDPNGVVGVRRFLERVWRIASRVQENSATLPASGRRLGQNFPTPATLTKLLNKTIKKMTEDIEEYKFNTAITQMMILLNAWEKVDHIQENEYKIFLQILAPFAPHIAEELWTELGEKKSIHQSDWPKWDPTKITDTTVTIVIQVNGKVRSEVTIPADLGEKEVEDIALKNAIIIPWIKDKDIKRIIYIKNRLINIVV